MHNPCAVIPVYNHELAVPAVVQELLDAGLPCVQVDWAIALGQRLMDLPSRFAGMEVLKFQQLVRPGDRITLTLRFDQERSKLHFAYRNGDAACSSGRILWSEADV